MNFQYQIIDNNAFQKYKPLRYFLYILLILFAFIIIKIRKKNRIEGQPNSISELLNFNTQLIFIILLIIGITAYFVYTYSKSYKKLGFIDINSQSITIRKENFVEIFDMNNVKYLKIERGSTWHYSHKEDNYLLHTDNWFKFMVNNVLIEIEFLIPSIECNKKFESMLMELKNQQIDFQYLSI